MRLQKFVLVAPCRFLIVLTLFDLSCGEPNRVSDASDAADNDADTSSDANWDVQLTDLAIDTGSFVDAADARSEVAARDSSRQDVAIQGRFALGVSSPVQLCSNFTDMQPNAAVEYQRRAQVSLRDGVLVFDPAVVSAPAEDWFESLRTGPQQTPASSRSDARVVRNADTEFLYTQSFVASDTRLVQLRCAVTFLERDRGTVRNVDHEYLVDQYSFACNYEIAGFGGASLAPCESRDTPLTLIATAPDGRSANFRIRYYDGFGAGGYRRIMMERATIHLDGRTVELTDRFSFAQSSQHHFYEAELLFALNNGDEFVLLRVESIPPPLQHMRGTWSELNAQFQTLRTMPLDAFHEAP